MIFQIEILVLCSISLVLRKRMAPEEDDLPPDVDTNEPDYIPTYPMEFHE